MALTADSLQKPLIILPSAARTATPAAATQEGRGYAGLMLFFDMTATGGAGGIIMQLQGQDPASLKWLPLCSNPAAVATVTTQSLLLGAGVSGGGGFTVLTNGRLPDTWRVNMSHQDGNSYTYSVGAVLLA